MINSSPSKIWNALKSSKSVLIPLHISPDGDSFGSSLAMYYILKNMGKQVTVVSADRIGGFYDLLDEYKIVQWGVDVAQLDFAEFDTVLSLDVTDAYRFAKNGDTNGYAFPPHLRIVAIDHHPGFKYFGNYNLHQPEYCSTAEILLDLAGEIGEIGEVEGNKGLEKDKYKKMLLLGILSDTGMLRWAVSPSVLEKVALLMKDVDYKQLWSTMLYNTPEENKRFQGLVLNNAIYNKTGRFVYSKISFNEMRDNEISKNEAGGGSDLLKDIRGYDFAFTITEKEPGKIIVSFRSQKGVDVSVFARALGNGGGHKAAAGVSLQNISIDEAEKIVLKAIKTLSTKL